MEVVNEAFNTVRQLLKSTVPPCTATIDNPEHYEVRSINPEHSKNILLGYVSKHADSITVGFNDKLGKNNMEQLFSKYLLQKMNEHKRMHIHEMNRQLHADLQEAINHLMRYYNEKNWNLP
ncbi:hypothetical protein [uncultured Coprobacter sp.]|jgi:hypothetical protein|uniref:hypothetical protein n=1 Tax=uncultured Coprobacter sp. TaxID=1720550 RepID=UPI0025F2849A|nr:hypothetical protein [uncultured Coprobacter sp.]